MFHTWVFPPPPKIAVKSFVEMTRYLLQPGKEKLSLLSERIAQDPLENSFGKQRAHGGRCDNPTLHEAVQNAVSICTQQSLELDHVQGNCSLFMMNLQKLITLRYQKGSDLNINFYWLFLGNYF